MTANMYNVSIILYMCDEFPFYGKDKSDCPRGFLASKTNGIIHGCNSMCQMQNVVQSCRSDNTVAKGCIW